MLFCWSLRNGVSVDFRLFKVEESNCPFCFSFEASFSKFDISSLLFMSLYLLRMSVYSSVFSGFLLRIFSFSFANDLKSLGIKNLKIIYVCNRKNVYKKQNQIVCFLHLCCKLVKEIGINKDMNIEDSRNALFVEPNAYIQNYSRQDKTKTQATKVTNPLPYERIGETPVWDNPNKNNNNQMQQNNPSRSGFDMKNIMSLLGALGKGKSDISGIMNLFGGMGQQKPRANSNGFADFISTMLSNKDMLSTISNLFLKKNDSSTSKEEGDFVINNYTKVD